MKTPRRIRQATYPLIYAGAIYDASISGTRGRFADIWFGNFNAISLVTYALSATILFLNDSDRDTLSRLAWSLFLGLFLCSLIMIAASGVFMGIMALARIVWFFLHIALSLARGTGVAVYGAWAAELSTNPGDQPEIEQGLVRDGRLILVQMSDLHITAHGVPYEIREGEAHWPQDLPPPDHRELKERLHQLLHEIAKATPTVPIIALTGDSTDMGTEAEWTALESTIKGTLKHDGMEKLEDTNWLILPGNHDVSINTGDKPDPNLESRTAKQRRFTHAMRALESGDWTSGGARQESLEDTFPRLIGEVEGVHVFGLNSNTYASRNIASNGVGLFGRKQLNQLQKQLESISGPVAVLTHHHVARPPDRNFWKDPFLIAVDGKPLLQILCAYNQKAPQTNKVLVLHGHRHLDYFGRYSHKQGVVDVYGHPSSTLGHEQQGRLDGVPRFASVWLKPDGWAILRHRIKLQN